MAIGYRSVSVCHIGVISLRLGKAELALTHEDTQRAAALRRGFDLSDWSIDLELWKQDPAGAVASPTRG